MVPRLQEKQAAAVAAVPSPAAGALKVRVLPEQGLAQG
jgi:hypothetical protein